MKCASFLTASGYPVDPFDRVCGGASAAALAFESDRINLAHDVEPERLERLESGNLRVEAARARQSLAEIHVIVMIHHLISGQRFEMVSVSQRQYRIERRLRRFPRWGRDRRPSAAMSPASRCRARSSARTARSLRVPPAGSRTSTPRRCLFGTRCIQGWSRSRAPRRMCAAEETL